MEKNALRASILAAFSEEAWAELAAGTQKAPVSAFNRALLLRLREEEADFPGEAEDGAVEELRQAVEAYLARQWAEAPEAHPYVTQACLAQTFLYEQPMHPPEAARWQTTVREGAARYFCPAREEGPDSVCRFCRAEPLAALREVREAQAARTARDWCETSAAVQREIFRAGFQDAGVVETAALRFHPEVRKSCEENRCRGYGASWACPPAVGTLEECRSRVLRFNRLQLFSKAYLLRDSMDFAGVGEAMGDFKACALGLGSALRPLMRELLILSNEGCGRCERCTWPEESCRFPEELQPSIEGFGFLVSELAGQAGLPYLNGKNTVTFFGAVLYEEEPCGHFGREKA